MLGRYVTGTLLILGVAMLIAPEAPERVEPEVTRADTSPLSLATASFEASSNEVVISEAPALSQPKPAALEQGDTVRIDAAVASVAQDEPARVNIALTKEIGGIATLAGLEPQPSGTVTPIVATPSNSEFKYVTGNRVNVRSGPSTNFRVISRVVYGDSVEILGREADGWAEIRILGSDEIGFMAERFLKDDLNG